MSQMIDGSQKVIVRKDGTVQVGTVNTEESKTRQEFKDECDINHIMKRYEQTGEVHHLNRKSGVYADLAHIGDFQGMMDKIVHAQTAFGELPAEVRFRFGNDPAQLIEFLQDTKNKDEAVRLGLIEAKVEKTNDSNDSKLDPKAKKADPPANPS